MLGLQPKHKAMYYVKELREMVILHMAVNFVAYIMNIKHYFSSNYKCTMKYKLCRGNYKNIISKREKNV